MPRLPVVLAGVSIAGARKYDRLLADLPNFFLETSQMIAPDEIRRLVGLGHGRRLIFGSGLPWRTIGGALGVLEKSGLPAAELAAIAAGNLLGLLGKPPAPAGKAIRPVRFIGEIIDLHIHQGRMHPIAEGCGNAADIIKNMDRCGVRRGMLTSLWACYSAVAEGNRAVAQAGRRFRGRLYGYLTLDPKHPAEIAQQLKLHGGNPVFRGIKAHCGLHGVELNAVTKDGSAERRPPFVSFLIVFAEIF